MELTSPSPQAPPLPRLARHHSEHPLPAQFALAAWAPASCVFLGMLGNSAEGLRRSRRNLPGVLAPGRALAPLASTPTPLRPEDRNFAGKKGVASELHLAGSFTSPVSGISVKFLAAWEACSLLGGGHPWGYWIQRLSSARLLFRAGDRICEASVVDLG